jgi:hypothetical protein
MKILKDIRPLFWAFLLVALACGKTTQRHLVEEAPPKVAKTKCDSLYEWIYSPHAGTLILPDTIPSNIDEAMVQLDTCMSDTLKEWMMCMTADEFSGFLHRGFGMRIRNYWGLWSGGDLAKQFNEYEVFHPDEMSYFIFHCFHKKVETGTYDFQKIIADYQGRIARMEHARKLEERQNRAFVDSVQQAIRYDSILQTVEGLVHDSLHLYIRRVSGDTVTYITGSGSSRLSREAYARLPEKRGFGQSLFFAPVGKEDGLGPFASTGLGSVQTFLARKDTLFFLDGNVFIPIFLPSTHGGMQGIRAYRTLHD